MSAILTKLTLKDRAGETLLEVYGRRQSLESDENLGTITAYNEVRDIYNVPWSSGLQAILGTIAAVERDEKDYTVARSSRIDQRTVQFVLGGIR